MDALPHTRIERLRQLAAHHATMQQTCEQLAEELERDQLGRPAVMPRHIEALLTSLRQGGARSQVFRLPLPLLAQLTHRLLTSYEPITETGRWLNSQVDEAVEVKALYRFERHLRRAVERLSNQPQSAGEAGPPDRAD